MMLLLHGPFERLASKELVLKLPTPLSLRKVIERLAENHPGFRPYLTMESNAQLSAHISFLREGRALQLDDMLSDKDTLHVLLPVTGG